MLTEFSLQSGNVIDYTRLNIDQRVLVKSGQDGYDFRYTYGLDKIWSLK